jgi:hypothetical protein
MIQVGVSLEMSHSWWRVGVLYLVGVLSGNTLPGSPEPVFINIKAEYSIVLFLMLFKCWNA